MTHNDVRNFVYKNLLAVKDQQESFKRFNAALNAIMRKVDEYTQQERNLVRESYGDFRMNSVLKRIAARKWMVAVGFVYNKETLVWEKDNESPRTNDEMLEMYANYLDTCPKIEPVTEAAEVGGPACSDPCCNVDWSAVGKFMNDGGFSYDPNIRMWLKPGAATANDDQAAKMYEIDQSMERTEAATQERLGNLANPMPDPDARASVNGYRPATFEYMFVENGSHLTDEWQLQGVYGGPVFTWMVFRRQV